MDGATFNPQTMEAFSSQGDGTLSVIKENSPTSFTLEQTVQTKIGGDAAITAHFAQSGRDVWLYMHGDGGKQNSTKHA